MCNKLSVIIPIYNVNEFLPRCIESVIAQTYEQLEIILIDDGSTDGSGETAEEYKKKDKRIKVIHKKNSGQADARNIGIKIATGDYITFVDADDYLKSDIYRKSMNKIAKKKVEILVFEVARSFKGKESVSRLYNERIVDNCEAIELLNSFAGIDYGPWNKIFKKSLFCNICFPGGKKCEDVYILYKLFNKANTVLLYPEVGYCYCYRPGSTTNSETVNIDYYYALKEQMEFFEKNDNERLRISTAAAYAYACLTIINMMIYKNNKDKSLVKLMRNESKKYSKYVFKNKLIKKKKKIQFFVFRYCFYCYCYLIKIKSQIVEWV